MSAGTALAVLCGLGVGIGAWSMLAAMPRLTRPRLADRVAPYVIDISDDARAFTERRTVDPLPVLGAIFAPGLSRLRRGFSALVGGSDVTRLRLRQAGSMVNVEQFRSQQLLASAIGFAAALALVILAEPMRRPPLVVQAAVPIVGAVCGFILRDRMLLRATDRRLRRVTSEFPTVLEFLTLSLSAGEGILDSLRRLSRVSSGELSKEFGVVVAEVNTGVPLARALHNLERGIRLPILTRCIDAITGALERGTPLAEVLRAQSQDARDESKRSLLEAAGKKEVAMLVPLVFLILPATVLFAIFPGLVVLQSGF